MTANNKAIDDAVKPILSRLNSVSKDIEASAIMSRDGHTLTSVLGNNVDPDRLGAMCASLLSLAEKTSKELDRGALKQVLIGGEKGSILLLHIGANAVLSIVAKAGANLGMVFVEAKKTATEIANTGIFAAA